MEEERVGGGGGQSGKIKGLGYGGGKGLMVRKMMVTLEKMRWRS